MTPAPADEMPEKLSDLQKRMTEITFHIMGWNHISRGYPAIGISQEDMATIQEMIHTLFPLAAILGDRPKINPDTPRTTRPDRMGVEGIEKDKDVGPFPTPLNAARERGIK